MAVANMPAYYDRAKITAVKRFIVQVPDATSRNQYCISNNFPQAIETKKARVFVPVSHFHPNLILATKA